MTTRSATTADGKNTDPTFGHLIDNHPSYFRRLDGEGDNWHTNDELKDEMDEPVEGYTILHWAEVRELRAVPVQRDYFGTFRVYRYEVKGEWYEQLELVEDGDWEMPDPGLRPDPETLAELRTLYAQFDRDFAARPKEMQEEIDRLRAEEDARFKKEDADFARWQAEADSQYENFLSQ